MRLILMEKPLAAKTLVSQLFPSASMERRGRVPVFRYNDTVVVPLSGHIIDVDFPEEFGRWSLKHLYELIEAPIREKIVRWDIYSVLRGLKPSLVIIATDADREGEAIGLEVVKKIYKNIPAYRAWFSSLSKEELERAFSNLGKPRENLAEAAFARRDVDLLWGATLTRAISLVSNRRGRDFLSIGRVQTPTLALVVERELQIRSFKPETFYYVKVTFDGGFVGTTERTKKKEEAELWLHSITNRAKVVSFNKKKESIPRPKPFDTTTFLSEANRLLGLSPSKAMALAEELYMMGYITYPRTDNQTYPPEAKRYASMLKTLYGIEEIYQPSKGRKTEDHPPIYPVKPPTNLKDDLLRVYDLIARRFLATFYRDGIVERREAILSSGGIEIRVSGGIVLDRGWTKIYPRRIELQRVPELTGEVAIREKALSTSKTTPPPRYSPGDLVKEMERLGLGTKSTRQDIISKLYKRGYIEGRKRIKPTKLGENLYNILNALIPYLLSPEITANLEREMDLIERGKRRREDVLKETRKILKEYVDIILSNSQRIKEVVWHDIRDEDSAGQKKKPVGKRSRASRTFKTFKGKKASSRRKNKEL